ncbi:MAG: glycosyltransferase [Anaerolineae bacterium]|nr:glycosyltransferase [Anaerolineae bacterium]
MNLLFLTSQWPYPPRQGGALRVWGLIAALAPRHSISILSFGDPSAPCLLPPTMGHLSSACCVPEPPHRPLRRRLRDLLFSRQPDMALRLESPLFRRHLAEWLEREIFDAVHIEGIEMASYLDLLEQARPRPLIIFDDFNCEYLLQKRAFQTDLRYLRRWPGALYSLIQWRRLRRYEADLCRRADHVVAVSAADAAALCRLVPGLNPTVIPNGVNVRAYDPQTPPAPGMQEGALVFTGKMDFRPNVDAVLWFVEDVLPRILAHAPYVHFWVVGQQPHPRLFRLRHHPAVTLTGYVEDTRPYIAGATVYVAPLRIGGGTRLKLLEAMAMEKAVVATPLGAEGYEVRNGEELLLADDPETFAGAVLSLLAHPARRAALGRAARRFVEQFYDWSVLVPRIEHLYRSISI